MPKDDKCAAPYCRKPPVVKVHDVPNDSGYWLCEGHHEKRLEAMYAKALGREASS